MLNRISKLFMTAGAAATIATGAIAPRAAQADTTSTLLTAAAAIGAIILYENVQRKQQAANTVVGYTRNGGTVYADGRIVMPDGQTYYPNSNGQYAIDQYGWNNGYNPQTYGYSPAPSTYYNGQQHRQRWQYQNANRQSWNQPQNTTTWQNQNNARWQNQNDARWNNQNNGRASNQNNGRWQNGGNERRDNDRDDNHRHH